MCALKCAHYSHKGSVARLSDWAFYCRQLYTEAIFIDKIYPICVEC